MNEQHENGELVRLKAENDNLIHVQATDGYTWEWHCERKDEEIERLRGELAQEKEQHDRCTTFHAIAVKERDYERVLSMGKDTEIERLRGLADVARLDVMWQELVRERDDAKQEIERLRANAAPAARKILSQQAEIERLRGTQCNWTDEGGDCWETDCGNGFQFNDGGPADNSFTHCPFCGGKLIVVQVDE